MLFAEGIRKFGFRRWYERQLIEAHACLVTAFLGSIVVTVCIDQFRWREAGIKPLILLGVVIAGILLCIRMVTVYYRVLFRAEHYAQQSTCSQCHCYGMLHVVSAPTRNHADGADEEDWARVRCRKCGHDWVMSGAPINAEIKKSM